MVVLLMIAYLVASFFAWPHMHDFLGATDPVASAGVTLVAMAVPTFFMAWGLDKLEGN